MSLFPKFFDFSLLTDRKILIKYRAVKLNDLIKSGGGNGPMKPGNLWETARCQIRRQWIER